MYLRHRYQSPDLPSTCYPDRQPIKALSPTITRYSSARLLDRISVDRRDLCSNLRKRIEQYSYNLSDIIGQGYTSKVYKAISDNAPETFAVKVVDLKKYHAYNKEMLESQVSILRTINHSNIIRCYDVYLTANNCYIVTEFCEGGDLMALLKKQAKGDEVSDGRLVQIMKDVLSGFKYLACKGIVHRDIKPANIFFRQGVAKIADFGFAKKAEKLKDKENFNVGTPLYMPPQSLVSSRYSLKSDIFSIGVLFYEMLFDRTPWESRTEKDLISKMSKNAVQFPFEIPSSLKKMLLGCLTIDENDRFSVQELFQCQFVRMLERSLDEIPPLRPHLSPRKAIPFTKDNETTKSTNDQSKKDMKSPERPTSIIPINGGLSKKMHHERNTSVLLVQLNLCRFMYYLAKNNIYLFPKIDKQHLNSILQLHILEVIDRLVGMDTTNTLKLTDYDNYKSTIAYGKVYSTVCQYHTRYHRQFRDATGHREPYQEILAVVKRYAQKLITAIEKNIDEQAEKDKMMCSIEGLRSLLKYISLLKMMDKYQEDYEYFTMFSNINVLTDYSKSPATQEEFQKLKKLTL